MSQNISLSNLILFLSRLILTLPILTLSKCFSLGNFAAVVSCSDLLLFRISVVEIDPQSLVFKTSDLLAESVNLKI